MKGIPETVNKGITRYFGKDGKEIDKKTFEELTKKVTLTVSDTAKVKEKEETKKPYDK
jgi:hypothetical protein